MQDNNQTIKFRRAFCDMQSLWTCVVSDDTNTLNYAMELIVTGKFKRAFCDMQLLWPCVVSDETGHLNYTMELIVTGTFMV